MPPETHRTLPKPYSPMKSCASLSPTTQPPCASLSLSFTTFPCPPVSTIVSPMSWLPITVRSIARAARCGSSSTPGTTPSSQPPTARRASRAASTIARPTTRMRWATGPIWPTSCSRANSSTSSCPARRLASSIPPSSSTTPTI